MPSRTEPRAARPVPIRRGLPGEDGKSVGIEDVRPVLEQLVVATVPAVVDAVVKLLPAPAKGEPGTPGEPGKSVTIEDVTPLVLRAVSTIPIPKADQGPRGEPGQPGKDAPLPKAWDFEFFRDELGFTKRVRATPVN